MEALLGSGRSRILLGLPEAAIAISRASVKIAAHARSRGDGARFGDAHCEGLEFVDHDVDDLALALDLAVREEQRRCGRDVTELVEDLRPQDEVDEAVLVFHRDEDDAARRTRALPADDHPGGFHAPALRKPRKLARRDDAPRK